MPSAGAAQWIAPIAAAFSLVVEPEALLADEPF